MIPKRLSQEGLKLIACITMLCDHIGFALIPCPWLRVIGRIAFPIYCFLLAEGAHYTKNPFRYALRLFLVLVLSEIPYELVIYGRLTLFRQSVMFTLLIGFVMLEYMKRTPYFPLKLAAVIPFACAADVIFCDYGSRGILLIALFYLTREMPWKHLIQAAGIAFLFFRPGGATVDLGFWEVPRTAFALAAMIPIFFYSGKKASRSAALQWAFYLFYPVHLALIYIAKLWLV